MRVNYLAQQVLTKQKKRLSVLPYQRLKHRLIKKLRVPNNRMYFFLEVTVVQKKYVRNCLFQLNKWLVLAGIMREEPSLDKFHANVAIDDAPFCMLLDLEKFMRENQVANNLIKLMVRLVLAMVSSKNFINSYQIDASEPDQISIMAALTKLLFVFGHSATQLYVSGTLEQRAVFWTGGEPVQRMVVELLNSSDAYYSVLKPDTGFGKCLQRLLYNPELPESARPYLGAVAKELERSLIENVIKAAKRTKIIFFALVFRFSIWHGEVISLNSAFIARELFLLWSCAYRFDYIFDVLLLPVVYSLEKDTFEFRPFKTLKTAPKQTELFEEFAKRFIAEVLGRFEEKPKIPDKKELTAANFDVNYKLPQRPPFAWLNKLHTDVVMRQPQRKVYTLFFQPGALHDSDDENATNRKFLKRLRLVQ